MARIINDVEVSLYQNKTHENRHHEQTLKTQRFASNVQCVMDVINELGNTFTETSTNLFTMDTKIDMAEEVIEICQKQRK